MAGGAAEVESLDRRAIVGVAGHRAVEEHLVEGQLTLEDVAFGEADLELDVPRRPHLLVQAEIAEVRAVAGDLGDRRLGERVARRAVPGPAGGTRGGGGLQEDRHYALAGGLHGWTAGGDWT